MDLHAMLGSRASAGQPIRIGIIGAGRFSTMFLAQAHSIDGIQVVAIADLNTSRAASALTLVGWPDQPVDSVEAAVRTHRVAVIDNAAELFDCAEIDVIVEATGVPSAAIDHALRAIATHKHIVMVTVEADAFVGPALADRARKAGVVYSLAYGDQPAIIMELVDWARSCGFQVVCAGKGTRFADGYHEMNPGNVWNFWPFSKELTDSGQVNPYLHTSFRDGTKAAIEMAAVANAAQLIPSDDGLTFSPGNVEQIASICRPVEAGGVLGHEGTVDVMSSLTPAGDPIPFDIQEGVYVVVKATNPYVSGCFREYPWHADASGQYMALYRPCHYVGLELTISIAHAAILEQPTGAPRGFHGDVVATAKRALSAGELLDGEGGYTVWGKLVSARTSVEHGLLPIAWSHGVELVHDIPAGRQIRWDDVVISDPDQPALQLRRETEAMAGGEDARGTAGS